MSELAVGESAPVFRLPVTGGGEFSLSAQERPVVLFFYPKDDTAGCTAEAVAFTGRMQEFEKLGVAVVGISPDSIVSHDRFRAKHQLETPLVSDEGKEILQAYGVWKEKSMYGRKYMGVERSTFLIDSEGRIRRIWRNVSVPGHVEEVLQAAREEFAS